MRELSNCKMMTFRFSDFLLLQFLDEFFVVTAHGTLDCFLVNQTVQRLLSGMIIGIAKGLGKLLSIEFRWKQTEAVLELVISVMMLSSVP